MILVYHPFAVGQSEIHGHMSDFNQDQVEALKRLEDRLMRVIEQHLGSKTGETECWKRALKQSTLVYGE